MTKSRLLFLFVLLCSVALVFLYNEYNASLLLLYAVGLLFLCALVTALLTPALIRIEHKTPRAELFKEEELRYDMRIRNRGVFSYPRVSCDYFNEELIEYQGDDRPVPLEPMAAVDKAHSVRFPYRGVYRVGIQRVRVTDFLGLFRFTVPVKTPLEVAVFPKADSAFAAAFLGDAQVAVRRRNLLGEDYTDVADVRKYTDADNMKMIHWKLSAKRGELIVKNYQPIDKNQILLCLDTRALPLEGVARAAFEDKMVSYAASAVGICTQGYLSAELIYGDPMTQRYRVDPMEAPEGIFRLLAGLRFDRDKLWLPEICARLGEGGNRSDMVLFLAGIDREIADSLQYAASGGHSLFVYLFHADELPLQVEQAALLEELASSGIAVHRVDATPVERADAEDGEVDG